MVRRASALSHSSNESVEPRSNPFRGITTGQSSNDSMDTDDVPPVAQRRSTTQGSNPFARGESLNPTSARGGQPQRSGSNPFGPGQASNLTGTRGGQPQRSGSNPFATGQLLNPTSTGGGQLQGSRSNPFANAPSSNSSVSSLPRGNIMPGPQGTSFSVNAGETPRRGMDTSMGKMQGG